MSATLRSNIDWNTISDGCPYFSVQIIYLDGSQKALREVSRVQQYVTSKGEYMVSFEYDFGHSTLHTYYDKIASVDWDYKGDFETDVEMEFVSSKVWPWE